MQDRDGDEGVARLLEERSRIEAAPTVALEERKGLRAPVAGWVRLSTTVGVDDELISVWCAPEHEAAFAAEPASPWRAAAPELGSGLPAVVTTYDAVGEQRVSARVPGLRIARPIAQRFSSGRTLIVGQRCRLLADGPERNAVIVDPDVAVAVVGVLGDGINHLAVTSAGAVWAGYTDVGVYGSNGWGIQGPPGPSRRYVEQIGSSGLIRFSETLEREWEFDWRPLQGQAEYLEDGDASITHVYAMNVVGETAWAYYYSPFAIARVEDGRVRLWSSGVPGADAMLVAGDRIGLVGGYDAAYDRFVVGRLGEHELVEPCQYRLVMPDGELLPPDRTLLGRGSTVHVLAGDRVLRLELHDRDRR